MQKLQRSQNSTKPPPPIQYYSQYRETRDGIKITRRNWLKLREKLFELLSDPMFATPTSSSRTLPTGILIGVPGFGRQAIKQKNETKISSNYFQRQTLSLWFIFPQQKSTVNLFARAFLAWRVHTKASSPDTETNRFYISTKKISHFYALLGLFQHPPSLNSNMN